MLIDLRQHFGLWARCGKTAYWKNLSHPPNAPLFVNPIEGIMISAHEYPSVGGPALRVFVRDASDVAEGDIKEAYKSNYPWVERVMNGFFAALWLASLGISKETPLSFFLKYYKDQTAEYKETGKGHQEVGKDEILEATTRLLGSLGKKATSLEKVILKDEIHEFLESYGILEC